jgi:uncharacterized protein (DUF608 family)
MKQQIPYTSLSGQAADLCAPGRAVEFIQPWYVPISTTPENTGMAVGGIGSTFTLTPLGHTPNFSFIPGIFIDNSDDAAHLNDFYASVADPISLGSLAIPDVSALAMHLKFYPATFHGELLDFNGASPTSVLERIRSALCGGEFYTENSAALERWQVEWTDKTQALLAAAPKAVETQLAVAMDFFNGLLVNDTAQARSLTARARYPSIQPIAAEQIDYRALYPMAEYRYDVFEGVSVHRKVVSPIVKGDKRLCSLPIHWNEFELTNRSDSAKVVTLVQSFDNLIGSNYIKSRPGVQDSCCRLVQNPIAQQHHITRFDIDDERTFNGVLLTRESDYACDLDGEVLLGIDTSRALIDGQRVTVSVKPSLYCVQAATEIKKALLSGRVNGLFDRGIYSGREALSALVCVRVELEPGECQRVRFAQSMDHAQIHLQDWQSQKAYTQFYPQAQRAVAMLADVLAQVDAVEQQIISQQQDFYLHTEQAMKDECQSRLPFATMAMNSLSFIAESTVWDRNDTLLVKECVDYPFFNSLDVYFYGSFSLLYLLPELDGCVMRNFADAILADDATPRRYWEYADKPFAQLCDDKYAGVRAVRGATPHDQGSPFDIQADAYSWHNVQEWKDLAPKYALMVLRHYQQTKDRRVVEYCWPAVVASLDYLIALIAEGDTIPLTRGTDDTFDNLSSHGVSIYCGSLWVAGLRSAAVLADLLGESEQGEAYRRRSQAALKTLEAGLWDEEQGYYHFFMTPIQVKHLTGRGFESLVSLGLHLSGDRVADKDRLNAFLDSAQEDNVKTQGVTKLEHRQAKKRLLLECAPQAFTPEFQAILELDSDNSFGDALLADSYLKWVGLEGLFEASRIERTLDFIYQQNYKVNSPNIGVANMTQADGTPCEAFQAQDVWIGVQFSVATALRQAGKTAQACELMGQLYDALYHQSKIPFAAPEGFNCSVVVTPADLEQAFELSEFQALGWFNQLREQGLLLDDGRVDPHLTAEPALFSVQVEGTPFAQKAQSLHLWLLHTGMKYTAGRYFRPGMIFAFLPEAL